MSMRAARGLAALALVVAASGLSACSTSGGPSYPATRVLGAEVDDLDPPSLALAAERTVAALGVMPSDRRVLIAGRRYSPRELAASARRVVSIARGETDPARLSKRLARECRAYPAGAAAKVTGYFEPVLDARRRRDERFRYPIYAPPSPAQLETLRRKLGRVPTRADIDSGDALVGLDLELAWLDDDVARFFLHVQGSGRLEFGDGSETRVGFAGTNELAYRSVGSVMLEQGLLERGQASATAMRRWLQAHPDRRDSLLFENPRYIFFRDNGDKGPIGALGTTLVAGRSIATDPSHIPRGALVWLHTTRPVVDADGRLVRKQPLTRFVFAQDAGAAIVGPARIDLFVGSGQAAGIEAGGMNEAGELYVLMCRAPAVVGAPGPPRRSWQHLQGP